MESVGTLAGGIAHEFNNILNIIKGYTLLIRQSPSVDENVTEKVNVIEETVSAELTVCGNCLLARRTESCLALSNPNDLVSELSKLLKQTFKTIDVTLELDAKFLPMGRSESDQPSAAQPICECSRRDGPEAAS